MSVKARAWVQKSFVGDGVAKAVLSALADYADQDGRCWPSQETLAADTEFSRRTIASKLAWLEFRGFIRRIERRAKGSGRWKSDVLQIVFARDEEEACVQDAIEASGEVDDDNLHVKHVHMDHVQLTTSPCAAGASRIRKEPSKEPSESYPGRLSSSSVSEYGADARPPRSRGGPARRQRDPGPTDGDARIGGPF